MNNEFNLFEAPLSGISLVEASAGTGKTYNIASLFVRAILEKKLMPANILVLTYTEAATIELKTRLRKRLKESIAVLEGRDVEDEFLSRLRIVYDQDDLVHLKSALYHFDEAAVSTIHGFCQRLLKENNIAFNVSSEFEILSESNTFLQDVIDEYWRDFLRNDVSEFQKALIHFILSMGYTPDKLLERVRLISSKPYVTHVPEVRSLDVFKKDYLELKESFKTMKKIFFEEERKVGQALKGDALNGNRYRNRFDHFETVKYWISNTELPIQAPDKLFLFGSFMYNEGEGKKKGKEIPLLKTFLAVDLYIQNAAKFSEIEISWMMNASNLILEAFKKRKQEQELLTYDDLLLYVAEGVGKNELLASELRKQYPVALVDEFQDTDPVQYSIFKKIYTPDSNTALFMIGDPKQAIYSFRGADIFTYLQARNDAHNNQRYSLSNNYRSSKKLVEAINNLFSVSDKPFLIEQLSYTKAQFPAQKDTSRLNLKGSSGETAPLKFVQIDSEDSSVSATRAHIAETVCYEILDIIGGVLLDQGPVSQSDIAVLVRTHHQGQEIQDSLREHGIKSVVRSKESVFKTREASELYLILSSIFDPSFEDGIRAALATEAFGFSAGQILNLLDNESLWHNTYSKFLALHTVWREKGFSRMKEELLKLFDIELNYGKFFDAERRITNLYHLLELIEKTERERQFSPYGSLKYLKRKSKEDSGNNSIEEIIRLESDDKLVQIVTMHASKGLEFPVVLCPYLWEAISINDSALFSFHNGTEPTLDVGSKGEKRLKYRTKQLTEDLAERIRLTYVALTRAKSACIVFLFDGADSELSPLISLLEGEKTMKERIYDKLALSSAKYKSTHKKEENKLSSLISSLASTTPNIDFLESSKKNLVFDQAKEVEKIELKTLDFSRNDLQRYSRITSFSSLSEASKIDTIIDEKTGFDYDEILTSTHSEIESDFSIFSLPKGAKTGTLFHEIFENILFNDPATYDPVIEEKVLKHGFSEFWKPVLSKSIYDSVNHCLFDDMKLKDLTGKECIVEMEFHFPVTSIDSRSLIEIIRNQKSNDNYEAVSGFMKGFIDLTFIYKSKYYLLDYKSNFLGDTKYDYDQTSIKNEILHSNYDLQYYIYSVALHRILKNTIPDYSYEKHFGGAIYLFLRGIDSSIEKSGVFFDKPELAKINALDNLIRNGRS